MRRIERTFLEIYPVIKNKERKKGKEIKRKKDTCIWGRKQKTETGI